MKTISFRQDFEQRKFVKVKNAKREFLCALCRAPRQMRYNKDLKKKNYLQMLVLAGFISMCLYPFMGLNAGISIFVILPGFEMINKFLYRKDLPCPYCGFDATWYRKDVKVARQKVTDFWAVNGQNAPKPAPQNSGRIAP